MDDERIDADAVNGIDKRREKLIVVAVIDADAAFHRDRQRARVA